MSRRPSYHIQLSKRAATDLRTIFAYLDTVAPASAPTAINRILDAIGTLKATPHRQTALGQNPALARPVRSMPVDSYVVFFRVLDDRRIVRVLRVRYGRRRPLKRFT